MDVQQQDSIIFSRDGKVLQRFDAFIFASLLEDRSLGLTIIGAAVVHTVLVIFGLPSWSCPIREFLGLPCPGCGLSRSITAFTQGDWKSSLTIHAFGPIILFGLVMLGVVTLLPLSLRKQIIGRIKRIEQRTKFTTIILAALICYWLVRLLFFRELFFGLVMS